MSPPFPSQAILCPIRFSVVALLATLLIGFGQVSGGSAQTGPDLVATRYFDAVAGDSILSVMSPRAVLHTPEGNFAGSDGPERFGDRLAASFSNLAFATGNASTVGEFILIEFTLTGMHTGTYGGQAPECAGVSVPALAIVQVEETGITRQWISYDQEALHSQIDAFSNYDSVTRLGCAGFAREQVTPDLCLDLDSCSYMP
jgi:hypothetical protein